MLEALQREHPDARVLTSPTRLGPGGGRNELVHAATHELVASFDDDSFPEHTDYFARLLETAARFPDAAIISAASQPRERRMPDCRVIDVASGCGCVFRRSWFLRTRGFVPLPIAYGMEEVDISLQLHALGGCVIHDPHLHVKHDKLPPTQVPVEVDATVLANIALLPVLRYPLIFAWVGVWQVLSRCLQMIRQGRWQALGHGLRLMPAHWRKHRSHAHCVPARQLLSWLILRRHLRHVDQHAAHSHEAARPVTALFSTSSPAPRRLRSPA